MMLGSDQEEVFLGRDFAQSKEKADAKFNASKVDFFKELSVAKELENAKLAEVNADADVKAARGDLKGFINRAKGKLKEAMTTSGTTLTAEEINAQALEKLGKDNTKLVEDWQKVQAEAVEKTGKAKELTADEIKAALEKKGIKGTEEEFVKATKDKAAEAIKPYLEKAKIGNKTVNGLIGAAVLGLIGLGIGASSKKDA